MSENRIDQAFARLRSANEKALIPFVTAGDPSLAKTKEIVLALERAGADIVELGVPFSDPMADGPVIQASSQRALQNENVSLANVLELVRDLRRQTQIPILLMGYYNPFFRYGIERLGRDAAGAGVDALLVVDLPPDESAELQAALRPAGVHQIFLLAPTSNEARLKTVTDAAGGFVYYVSITGVTGAQVSVNARLEELVGKARVHTELPICVGFGIKTPEQVREICGFADGAVVGSALVSLIHENADDTGMLDKVQHYVSSLKAATRD